MWRRRRVKDPVGACVRWRGVPYSKLPGFVPELQMAAEAWRRGAHRSALHRVEQIILDSAVRYAALTLRGDILYEMGDYSVALRSYDALAEIGRTDPLLDCARGRVHFMLGRFAASEKAFSNALAYEPNFAEAHYGMGLVYELLGNGGEGICFRHAHRCAPEQFESYEQLSPVEFEDLIQDARTTLPPAVRELAGNLHILVKELPTRSDLDSAPGSVTPLSCGVSVSRSVPGRRKEQPAILLFKRNLERSSDDQETLLGKVRLTMLRLVAQQLGISEVALFTYRPQIDGVPS